MAICPKLELSIEGPPPEEQSNDSIDSIDKFGQNPNKIQTELSAFASLREEKRSSLAVENKPGKKSNLRKRETLARKERAQCSVDSSSVS